MKLTDEQQAASDSILAWINTHSREKSLGGYAGTGKSTLIKHLIKQTDLRCTVMALAGKAVSVLRKKGVQANTIHSTIYHVQSISGKPVFTRKHPDDVPGDLLIVDEASMVSREIYNDLLDLDRQILWVGDHGQLEPIGDSPNLMLSPDLPLETIHRQALGNPIIPFAHSLRQGTPPLNPGEICMENGEGVLVIPKIQLQDADALGADQMICAYNNTRTSLNRFFRHIHNRGEGPEAGDRVICLKNNSSHQIWNGLQGVIQQTYGTGPYRNMEILCEDGNIFSGTVCFDQFNRDKGLCPNPQPFDFTHWDYAYAITCHKAQGSEWDFVIVVEEPSTLWSMERWRYTAATRAANKLIYCTP